MVTTKNGIASDNCNTVIEIPVDFVMTKDTKSANVPLIRTANPILEEEDGKDHHILRNRVRLFQSNHFSDSYKNNVINIIKNEGHDKEYINLKNKRKEWMHIYYLK